MTDPKESLSEIDRLMRESRERDGKSWVVPLVWGGLTLAALAGNWLMSRAGLQRANPYGLIWVAHNLLGWAFTFAWIARERAATGRSSLKGLGVTKIWAMYTLAMWLAMWNAHEVNVPLICTVTGLALLASGVVLEAPAAQVLGVLLSLFGTIFPALAPTPEVGVMGDLVAMPVAMLLWAAFARKARA